MKSMLVIAGVWIGLVGVAFSGSAVLEEFLFDEPAGTSWSGLTNGVGAAFWEGSMRNVRTDGAGALEFSQGDNAYRNAALSVPRRWSGVYELSWTYLSGSTLSGASNGANTGFGFRSFGNQDLFMVRIQRDAGAIKLQTRIDGVNETHFVIGGDRLEEDLTVRVVADLDADTLALYYAYGGEERCAVSQRPIVEGSFDQLRCNASLTAAKNFGKNDAIRVDRLRLVEVEPSEFNGNLLLGGLF